MSCSLTIFINRRLLLNFAKTNTLLNDLYYQGHFFLKHSDFAHIQRVLKKDRRNKSYSLSMFELGEKPRDTESCLENCSPRRTKPKLYTNICFSNHTYTCLLTQSQNLTSAFACRIKIKKTQHFALTKGPTWASGDFSYFPNLHGAPFFFLSLNAPRWP